MPANSNENIPPQMSMDEEQGPSISTCIWTNEAVALTSLAEVVLEEAS